MSALAHWFLAHGAHVSGSDAKDSPTLHRLAQAGAVVHVGHDARHLGAVDRVVYSAAIPAENPELVEAKRRGLPLISRAALLGEVLARHVGIAIAGTHGKTTTTAMTAAIFLAAGRDPTILLGGDWEPIGGNVRVGGSDLCIVEACEAFNSFLELRPHHAAVTNIDADHLEFHGDLDGVKDAFARFLAARQAGGVAVICLDDPHARAVAERAAAPLLGYGIDSLDADLRAFRVEVGPAASRFRVTYRGTSLGAVRLTVPGLHNVRNALAAIGLALVMEVPFDAVQTGLATFRGVGRRFERLGEVGGVLVIDDYAHHPTEIVATLASARTAYPERRLWAVFQPHLYSRTQRLMDEFARALAGADRVLVTEIYAAREPPIPGVTGEALAEATRALAGAERVAFAADLAAGAEYLRQAVAPGDLVLVMGAGDVRHLGESLVHSLTRGAKN